MIINSSSWQWFQTPEYLATHLWKLINLIYERLVISQQQLLMCIAKTYMFKSHSTAMYINLRVEINYILLKL
jgi:hypothetical protein